MILRRHLFARHLRSTLAVLAFVLVVLTLGQFADTARHIGGENGVSAFVLLWRAALRSPMLLQYALPHAMIIATVVVLHRMGSHRELAVLCGTGLSGWQMLAPMMLSGLVAGAGYVFVLAPLSGAGLERAEVFDRQMLGLDDAPRPRQIAALTDDGIVYVFARAVSAEGGWMRDVSVYRLDHNHRLIGRIDIATAGRNATGAWQIDGYQEAEGTAPAQTMPPPVALPFDPDLLMVTLAPHEATTLYDLPRAAAYAASVAAQPLPYRYQFHRLLALPALLAALVLVGGAVGLHLRPNQHWGRRALEVVALIFPLYVLVTVIEALAVRALLPPVLAAWGLPVFLALFALALIRARSL